MNLPTRPLPPIASDPLRDWGNYIHDDRDYWRAMFAEAMKLLDEAQRRDSTWFPRYYALRAAGEKP